MIGHLAQVAAGGAIGAVLRFLLGAGMLRLGGPGFPLGILTANVIGSVLMGVFVAMATSRGLLHLSPFVAVGLLGGFTTFSSFSLEAVRLVETGAMGQAALYVGLSVGGGIAALALGLSLGRALA